jgi:tetratricopeptide (TPR) repeat protein
MTRPLLIITGLLVALLLEPGLARPAVVQSPGTPTPKDEFVTALRQFAEALAGNFGDEREKVWSSIESMDRALVRWDEAIQDYRATLPAAEARNADVHLALGITYLDRSLIEDALREFVAASRLDPRRVDIYTFLGTTYGLLNRPAQATSALLKASALDPGDPKTFYRLAQQLLKNGQHERAIKALSSFRESQRKKLGERPPVPEVTIPFMRVDLLRQTAGVAPIFPPARYAPGFTLLKRGQYRQALLQFRGAAAADPLSTRSVATIDQTAQGVEAMRQGQLGPALGSLEAAIELAPGRAEARRMLGIAYRADEQYDNSIEQFKAAIRLDPHDERSSIALADVLETTGRLNEAEEVLKRTLQSIPGSGQAHYNLGRLYKTELRYSEALHELEDALGSNPLVGADYLLQTIIGIYLVQTDFDHAIDACIKRIEINPNNPLAHRELGRTYLEQGRHDEALAELMAALLIQPRDAATYALMGQSYLSIGSYAEAADWSSRTLEINGADKGARFVLGSSLMRLGRVEEGTRELQEFQRLQAEATAVEAREWELKMIKQDAAASIERQDYDKAAALLEKAVPYEPDVPATYLSLGVILMRAGRYEPASESFRRALELNAGPEVHRHLADAYEALGRREEAQNQRALYDRFKEERLRKAGGSR